MESVEIDKAIAEVRAAAGESGTLILETLLSLDGVEIPTAAVPSTDYPSLIRHIKPKVIYLFVTTFDAAEELEASLEDEDALKMPRAKKLIADWRSRNGETSRMVVSAMCDGILHGILEEADWLSDFEEQVETLAAELEEMAEENERKMQAESQKKLSAKVKKLMADARFNGPKVGVAKRTTLAESLFPDLDRDTIRAIVELAEKERWLSTEK
jgi:hypothetical protein